MDYAKTMKRGTHRLNVGHTLNPGSGGRWIPGSVYDDYDEYKKDAMIRGMNPVPFGFYVDTRTSVLANELVLEAETPASA